MSQQHTGNVTPATELEEHRSVGGVNAKAVVLYGWNGTSMVPITTDTSGGIYPASKAVLRFVVSQGAPGTVQLAPASPGLKNKVVGGVLTMSANGTLKFADDGADLTGAMDIAQYGGFVVPPNSLAPFVETSVNSGLNLITTGGTAKGVVLYIVE